MKKKRKKIGVEGFISDEYDWSYFTKQSFPIVYASEFPKNHTKVRITIEEI